MPATSDVDDKIKGAFSPAGRAQLQLGQVQPIALVARVTGEVHLRGEDAPARRLHLDVDVARAAGVLRRDDRLQPVTALRVGVLVPAVAEAAVVVGALLVRVPEKIGRASCRERVSTDV